MSFTIFEIDILPHYNDVLSSSAKNQRAEEKTFQEFNAISF